MPNTNTSILRKQQILNSTPAKIVMQNAQHGEVEQESEEEEIEEEQTQQIKDENLNKQHGNEQVQPSASPASDCSPSADEELMSNEMSTLRRLRAKIIDSVQQYACLWDAKSKTYHDFHLKKQAWVEISRTLVQPVELIKNEWSKLRDNHRKCIRKREVKFNSGEKSNSKMPSSEFFDRLYFLRDELPPSEGSAEVNTVETCVGEEGEQEELVVIGSPSTKRIKKRKKNSDLPSKYLTTPVKARNITIGEEASVQTPSLVDTSLLQQALHNINANTKVEERDHDELFCLSLVEGLRSLPKQKNAVAKIRIQQLLYELQYES